MYQRGGSPIRLSRKQPSSSSKIITPSSKTELRVFLMLWHLCFPFFLSSLSAPHGCESGSGGKPGSSARWEFPISELWLWLGGGTVLGGWFPDWVYSVLVWKVKTKFLLPHSVGLKAGQVEAPEVGYTQEASGKLPKQMGDMILLQCQMNIWGDFPVMVWVCMQYMCYVSMRCQLSECYVYFLLLSH